MSSCCNVLCIIDKDNLDTLVQKTFTPSMRLPVLIHDDIIDDFKNIYCDVKKTSIIEAAVPIVRSSSYEFVHYAYIVRSQLIYLAIIVPFIEDIRFGNDCNSTKIGNTKSSCESVHASYDMKTVNVMTSLVYLDNLHQLIAKYFNNTNVTPMLIANNYNLLDALLDESIDFGVPQLTNYNVMQEYIKIKPVLNDFLMEDVTEFFSDNDNDNDNDNAEDQLDAQSNKDTSSFVEKERKQKNIGWLNSGKELLSLSHKSRKSKNKSKFQSYWGGKEGSTETLGQDETYMNSFLARTTTSAINWRPHGIYYAKNEFFLDVVEKLQYYQDLETGEVRENFLTGIIFCKSYLSGMPELKVGISDNKLKLNNEALLKKNFRFHHCVQLEDLDDNCEIKFIPPDGEFELANYEFKRRRNDMDPPIIKIVKYEIKEKPLKHVRIFVDFTTYFRKQSSTTKLKIQIPILNLFSEHKVDLTKNPKFKTDWGKLYFNISDDFVLWDIGDIKGGYGDKTYGCVIQFDLINEEALKKEQELLKNSMDPPPLRQGPKLEVIYQQLHGETGKQNESKKTDDAGKAQLNSLIESRKNNLIKVEFEIPYYTSSGLKIDFLKIHEKSLANYQSFPWIRYKTTNDDAYCFQTPQ